MKKLSPETKVKLIYSGELALIAVVFLVIATLEITGVMPIKERHQKFFNWVTIFGGTWMLIDFFWALFSKKRRPRICLLDKALTVPLAIYLISFDLYCFLGNNQPVDLYRFGMPIAFYYIVIIYTFEAIYHWKHPLPQLLEELQKEANEEKKEETIENNENNEQ